MKTYVKPELEEIMFVSEEIADEITGKVSGFEVPTDPADLPVLPG